MLVVGNANEQNLETRSSKPINRAEGAIFAAFFQPA